MSILNASKHFTINDYALHNNDKKKLFTILKIMKYGIHNPNIQISQPRLISIKTNSNWI